ncbi:MAG: HipA domain-containing protein [Pseudomonadota bacterium]
MNYCLRCNKQLDEASHYGQHLKCFEEIFRVEGRVKFHSLVRKSSTSDAGKEYPHESPHLTSYFGGNYRKYEGILGDARYILKLSKEEYPELAPVEFVCNKIAYHCGLAIPTPFTLINLEEGELAFVSRNFMDRQPKHATINHLYHYLKPGPEHYTVEELNRAIYRETSSAADVEMFIRILLVDALVGNHDRHGKNLALIVTAKGKRLTPIYDNPSYLGLESGAMLKADFAPKGKIWTKASKEPEMTEYLAEIERLGVFHIAKEFYKKISRDTIHAYIDDSHSLSDRMKTALLKLILRRYGDLENYVNAR